MGLGCEHLEITNMKLQKTKSFFNSIYGNRSYEFQISVKKIK